MNGTDHNLTTDVEVRPDPADIDAAWMTAALESTGAAQGATVQDVAVVGDIGTGQAGRNTRLALTWDDPESRPTSIVGKFPSTDPGAASIGFEHGLYLAECGFYRNIAPTLTMRRPDCYFASYDTEPAGFVILLEDLSNATQGDQLDGLTNDQIALAIEQAVALHAPRFGDPNLETDLGHGGAPADRAERAEVFQPFYEVALQTFEQRLGDRLSKDIVEVCKGFAPHVGQLFFGTDTPYTLTHTDFRADNLMFGNTDGKVTVLDFQTLAPALGMADISYLASGSCADPAERARVERDMVEDYRTQMAAAGVEMSADQCWYDYRFGSCLGLFITVMATLTAEQTERGDDLFVAMAQRHGQQAIDLELLDMLASRS